MGVSFIIVNYNTKELLYKLFESIELNVKNVQYEIIVVDNNSHDGSCEQIKTNFPRVKLIENTSNVGFSKANNQAAKIAQGQYLLFLNSDTIVCERVVEAMFAFLEKESTTGVVSCKLLNRDNSLQRSCGIFPRLSTEFYYRTFLNRVFSNSKFFNAVKLGTWDYSSVAQVDWVSGACFMIRKKLFHDLGGFDQQLYMFYEDTDLCLRVKNQGWEIHYIPDVSVYHLHGGSWQKDRSIPIINGCKSAIYFFRKHHKKWEVLVLKFFIVLETILSYFLLTPYLLLIGEDFGEIKSRIRGHTACFKFVISDSLRRFSLRS